LPFRSLQLHTNTQIYLISKLDLPKRCYGSSTLQWSDGFNYLANLCFNYLANLCFNYLANLCFNYLANLCFNYLANLCFNYLANLCFNYLANLCFNYLANLCFNYLANLCFNLSRKSNFVGHFVALFGHVDMCDLC
jgi:hypothetical protein